MEPQKQVEIRLAHMCNNRCVFCVSGQRTAMGEALPLPAAPVIAKLGEARAQGHEKLTLLGGRRPASEARLRHSTGGRGGAFGGPRPTRRVHAPPRQDSHAVDPASGTRRARVGQLRRSLLLPIGMSLPPLTSCDEARRQRRNRRPPLHRVTPAAHLRPTRASSPSAKSRSSSIIACLRSSVGPRCP